MKLLGKIVLVLAAGLLLYAVLIFDPSVDVGAVRVANFHKLSWQQNLIIVGVGLSIIGTLLILFGPKERAPDRAYSHRSTQHQGVDDAALAVEDQFADAIREGDVATLKRLLSNHSISPHGRNKNGKGWLQYATAFGSVHAAAILIEHGASPRDKDDLGRTAQEDAQDRANAELLDLFAKPRPNGSVSGRDDG